MAEHWMELRCANPLCRSVKTHGDGYIGTPQLLCRFLANSMTSEGAVEIKCRWCNHVSRVDYWNQAGDDRATYPAGFVHRHRQRQQLRRLQESSTM